MKPTHREYRDVNPFHGGSAYLTVREPMVDNVGLVVMEIDGLGTGVALSGTQVLALVEQLRTALGVPAATPEWIDKE